MAFLATQDPLHRAGRWIGLGRRVRRHRPRPGRGRAVAAGGAVTRSGPPAGPRAPGVGGAPGGRRSGATPCSDAGGVLAVRPSVPVERLAALEVKIARAVTATRSDATRRAYRADWNDFVRWCAVLGVDALPAAPVTVAAYLAELADPDAGRAPRAVSTIRRRLAAIGGAHRLAGHPNPGADPLVRDTMNGIRRLLGTAPAQKKPVTTAELAAVVARLGTRPIDDRDRCLLLVGYAAGLRRSELAGLDVTDLDDHPAGLVLHLRKSKADQERSGRRVGIVTGTTPATCPVRAWHTWRTTAGLDAGPVFRPVDRYGTIAPTRLSAYAIALVVKRHLAALGGCADDYAGHSLRRGLATTAARNGASERTIMRTTGHTSIRTVRSYIDDSDLFDDNASRYLGL